MFVSEIFTCWLLLACFGFIVATVFPARVMLATEPSVEVESLGVGGFFRPGLWTEVTLKVDGGDENTDSGSESGVAGRLEISFPDGDGFPAFFSNSDLANIRVGGGESQQFRVPVKIGRKNGQATIRIVDAEGGVVLAKQFRFAKLATAIPSLQPIWLAIGKDIGLKRQVDLINRNYRDEEQIRLIEVDSLAEFPRDLKSSESIEQVYLSLDEKNADNLPESQTRALKKWVRFGGSLILVAGEDNESILGDGGPLADILPGKYVGSEEVFSSIALENLVGAREDFLGTGESFSVAKIETTQHVALGEKQVPIIVRGSVGFGRVTFCGVALEKRPFRKWKYRDALLSSVVDLADESEQTASPQTTGGKVVNNGYTDISGQLRSSLDQFAKVGFVNFTLVAILTILYLLCIGPGDWLLLRRVMRKMELTWVTFPLITVIFGAAAIMLFRQMKTNDIQLNQVEVIDIDVETNQIRGNIWSHLYSPVSETVDLQFNAPKPLLADNTVALEDQTVSWHGFPGKAVGGMAASANAARPDADYKIENTAGNESDSNAALIRQIPLQVSSTRSFKAQWRGELQSTVKSELTTNTSTYKLNGRFTNPFSFPISNVVILHGEWARVYTGVIQPGGMTELSLMEEQGLDIFLTKSRLIDGKDQAPKWDAASLNTPRVFEMMLFHGAAGGGKYTKLSQRFNVGVDMSASLSTDSAILIGRTKSATHRLHIDGESVDENYDQQWTFVRVQFPVEVRRR